MSETIKVGVPIVETITKRGKVYVNVDDVIGLLSEAAVVLRNETNRDAALLGELAICFRRLRDERR